MALTQNLPVQFRDSSGGIPILPEQQLIIGTRVVQRVDNWRKKIAASQDATGPYFSDRLRVLTDQPGYLMSMEDYVAFGPQFVGGVIQRRVDFGYGYAWRLRNFVTSITSGPIAHDASVSTQMRTAAKTKLLAKLRNEQTGMDGLVFLGELRETIQMIRHPAEALRKGVYEILQPGLIQARKQVQRRVRRRHREENSDWLKRKAVAFKDAAAGTWLEFAFGLKPAISDSKEIVETSIRAMTEAEASGVQTLRAKVKSPLVKNPSYNSTGGWTTTGRDTVDRQLVWSKSSEASVMYRCGVRRRNDFPQVRSLERLRGLFGVTAGRILPALWELTPWSFLVDYFVNVGDLLEASLTSTDDVVWANYTDRQATLLGFRGSWRVRTNTANPRWVNYLFTAEGDYRELQHTTITRTVELPANISSIPLTFSLPGSDSLKWVNCAALVAQMAKWRA